MQDRNFIRSLTGLRFVAAATVAIGHGSLSLRQDWLGQLVAQVSSVGMTLFFVLSGFVLWLNYAARFQTLALSVSAREFAIARFARLYPMYAVVVLGVAGWVTVVRGAGAPSLGFILTMTQAWFPVRDGTTLVAAIPQLQHLWSISVELFFYSLFPAVCLLFGRIERLQAVTLLFALNLVIFAGAIVIFFVYGGGVLHLVAASLHDGGMQWLTYYAPYLHISQFLAGCLSAMIYVKLAELKVGIAARRGAVLLFWLAVAGLLTAPVVLFLQYYWGGSSLWVEVGIRCNEVVCFSVILVATSRFGVARLLGSRPMLLGGECSYSFYLLHSVPNPARHDRQVRYAAAARILVSPWAVCGDRGGGCVPGLHADRGPGPRLAAAHARDQRTAGSAAGNDGVGKINMTGRCGALSFDLTARYDVGLKEWQTPLYA